MSELPLRSGALIGAALALLGLLFAAAPAPEQAGLTPLRQAEAHFAAGEFTLAEATFQQAKAQLTPITYPEDRLAALYQRWNRPAEGLAVLEAAPAAEPQLRLQLLAAAGDWDALETAARRRLEAAPDETDTHALLTQALLQQLRCAEAESAAAAWARLAPNAEAELTHAILRFAAAPDTAGPQLCAREPEFCTVLRACTNGLDCSRRLGETLLRRRQPALAACALTHAIAEAPADADAHAWLGAALEQLGQPAAALPHYEQATALAPDAPLGWLLLGMARFNQQDIAGAREALLRAQRLDPGNPAPCLAMTAVLAAQSRYADIPIWTAAALERAPEDAEIWKGVARFYLARNLQLEGEPLHAAEGAVRLAAGDAEAWTLLGWAKFNTREFDAALDALQTALVHDARRAETYHFLGLTLQALERHAEAEAAFTRAADLGYRR